MLFKDIPGQQAAKNGLIRMALSNRMAHALLLTGPPGTGALPMCIALAQFLFCEYRLADDACGACASCRKVQKLQHPDLHLTFPVIKLLDQEGLSKEYINDFRTFIHDTPFADGQSWILSLGDESKKGNINAAACEEIIRNMALKSFEGGLKVQVLWMPELLDKEGNKLLKVIEEPPPNTIFLLASENPQRILPTILSRTQLVKLSPATDKEIADALLRQKVANDRQAQQVSLMAAGSYGVALGLVHEVHEDMIVNVRQWFNAMATHQISDMLQFADNGVKQGREYLKSLFLYTLTLLEETVRYQHGISRDGLLPEAEYAFVQKLAARQLSVSTMQEMISIIGRTQRAIAQNAHVKTQLVALCIRLSQCIIQKV